MNSGEVERIALWWGPGILLLLVFGYGFLRLAQYWIGKTTDVKLQQSASAFGIARQYVEQFLSTQKSQAEAFSRLATSVEHRDSHESFEHQEILIALKAMHRDMNLLYCRKADPPCAFRRPRSEGPAHERHALVGSNRVQPAFDFSTNLDETSQEWTENDS